MNDRSDGIAAQLVATLVRPEIRALSAYEVAKAEGMVKLDAMENPHALPETTKASLAAALGSVPINRYPDGGAAAVRTSLREAFGIADDWDNRGGGRAFEFDSDGAHYVRMELPGYQTRQLEIDVRPDAKDSISIDEDLERYSHAPYEKLPAVAAQTTGAVELQIEPADASVSEEGKFLGAASSFGPGSPMKLKGPTVHDLVLSAPGYKPKPIRILVAPNAGKDVAKISEKLKKE